MSNPFLRAGIVDDEVAVAGILRDILERAGCSVVEIAHTHADGLALVQRTEALDVVFVDLQLDGKSSGAEIAAQGSRNGLSVVVMTGSPRLPDELSGVGLLLKPFTLDQVRMLLHELRRSGRR